MSVRLSATDWADGGISEADVVAIARAFAAHGCDLLDVSTGQTVADAAPVYGRMFQVPFSDMIRNETGLATMCVGSITSADQVNTILAAGRADLVALARPHLVDPVAGAAGKSFPSGHAATSFAGAWVLGSVWPRRRGAFLVLATLVSLSRVYLGAHDPGEILAGTVLGVGLAELLRRLFDKLLAQVDLPKPPGTWNPSRQATR